jgi:hypothetical protein
MERTPRRRHLRLLAVVLGLPIVAVGPWAYAATSAPEVPTISFSATGTVPLVCGTRPNVTNLAIKHGTRVIIANRTGVAATVDIGRRRLLDLADGTGALVRLRSGQHELRMIPDCVVVTETETAAVNVLTRAQLSESLTPTPVPSGAPSDPDDPEVMVQSTSDPASTREPPSTDRAPTGSTVSETSTSAAQPGTLGGADPTGPPTLDGRAGPDEIAVVEVGAIRLDEGSDPKGLRLVGAIATICVLGVTAAIIRAIVSEGTTRSVG